MELEIFSDETNIEDKNGKEYLGIACLFVPTSYKPTLSNKLSKLRCLHNEPTKWSWNFKDCRNECKEQYHNINNFEIHSTKIENNMSKSKLRITADGPNSLQTIINIKKIKIDCYISIYYMWIWIN